MTNPFSIIGHWFSSLFHGSGDVVQQVLHGVSSFVNLAAPIVEKLAEIDKALPASAITIAAQKVLEIYQQDAAVVSNWLASVKDMTDAADILRSAATAALSALVPAGAASSAINLAIELAYSIYKASKK